MNTREFPHPFDSNRLIGTICEVTPSTAKANLPNATTIDGGWLHGHPSSGGRVGDFVVIDGGDLATLARIVAVQLPGKDRLSLLPYSDVDGQPVANLQLLTSVDLSRSEPVGGIARHPLLGSKVFSAHPQFLRWVCRDRLPTKANGHLLLGSFAVGEGFPVQITPEHLFGRHCAVLGATGGGKSWTLARIIEQAIERNCKILLLDATGEFSTLTGSRILHCGVGGPSGTMTDDDSVAVPHSELNEEDLFALFSPSGQSQAPKLRAAMKTLKLLKLARQELGGGNLVKKANQSRAAWTAAYSKHRDAIEGPRADFDIKYLARQIDEECVRPAGADSWGAPDEQARGYCTSLVNRIEATLAAKELACLFPADNQQSLFKRFAEFWADTNANVLRVSLKHLSFAFSTREIIVNAIGRRLLEFSRDGQFRARPLVVVVDEAHQFLSKELGDDNNRSRLDSFDLIAKEGRKYWLVLCLATQRPRDIPEGVMSQMGTLIVHRLTNEADRNVVERAAGEIDRGAAAFLPTLAPGEAAIVGGDFRVPLTVRFSEPRSKPDSSGPVFT